MPGSVDDALLEAGRAAFQKYGYAGTTLERLAGEAGLSRVTLHRRGVTRDGLLAAMAERGAERYRAALWPALTGAGSGRERLDAALRALCGAAEENLELLVALRAQSDAVFHDRADEALAIPVFTEPLERLLLDGAADGSLRRVEAAETATLLFNMVGWTYIHLRTGHRWRAEDATRACVDLVLEGL